MGLARQSASLSVNRVQKCVEKPKLVSTFSRVGVTGVDFQLTRSKVRAGVKAVQIDVGGLPVPRNMSYFYSSC